MKLTNFLKAIEIISKSHSTQLFINKPYNGNVGDLGVTDYNIRIKDCCGKVMSDLVDAGFTLSMKDGLTTVDDYGIKMLKLKSIL